MIEIRTYSDEDREEVIRLVLHCQNDGTRPSVSVDDQPELRRIPEKYMDGGGNFWVAKDNGKTAGSIGLMKFGDGTAVLKKFFVYEPYRGAPCHLGRQLYGTLLDYARTHGVKQLILDTPKNTDRAHKFYERAGFTKIERADVPVVMTFLMMTVIFSGWKSDPSSAFQNLPRA